MLRAACLLPLLALTTTSIAAAEPSVRSLTLSQAIHKAVGHSPALAISRADYDAAVGARQSAAGLDDPVLTATQSYNGARPSDASGLSRSDNLQFGVGLTQPLPTGGSVSLGLSAGWQDGLTAAPTGGSSTTALWSSSAQLTLSHSLARGLGVGVARAPQRRARIGVEIADVQRHAIAAALLRDVTRAYWELYYAERELEIRRAAAAAAHEQLQIVRANVEVGKQSPSATAEIDVAIAQRAADAIAAEGQRVERALELAQQIGADLSAAVIQWRTVEAPSSEACLPPPDEVIAHAEAENSELLAARARIQLAAVDVDVTRDARLPQLDVSISAGPIGLAPRLDDALSQLGRFKGHSVTTSLIFSEPLPNRAANGALASARATAERAAHTEAALRQQLRASALSLVASADRAARQAELLTPAMAAADLDLEAERARFVAGRSTNFDVLRRQDEVAQVRLRQARVQVDYQEAVAAVEALTGQILQRWGVTLR